MAWNYSRAHHLFFVMRGNIGSHVKVSLKFIWETQQYYVISDHSYLFFFFANMWVSFIFCYEYARTLNRTNARFCRRSTLINSRSRTGQWGGGPTACSVPRHAALPRRRYVPLLYTMLNKNCLNPMKLNFNSVLTA